MSSGKNMGIETSAMSIVYVLQKTKNKTNKNNNNKNKENFKSNLVLVSKGLYCCILMSGSTIVSQQ